jgi:hypothetical protein
VALVLALALVLRCERALVRALRCSAPNQNLHTLANPQSPRAARRSPHRAADVVVAVLLEVERNEAPGLRLEQVLDKLLVLQRVGAAVVAVEHDCAQGQACT